MSANGSTKIASPVPLGTADSPGIPAEEKEIPAGEEETSGDMLRKLPINPMLKKRLIQAIEELHSLAQEDRQLNPAVLVKIVQAMLKEMSGVGLNQQQTRKSARGAF